MTSSKEIDGVSISKREALDQLWRKGILYWKLDKTQKKIYNDIKNSKDRKYVVNCSRRLGKSFLLCIIAIEYALQHKNARICYASFAGNAVKNIILPLMREILEDCPKDLVPRFRVKDQKYEFHTGSVIDIAGTDAQRAENLRGQTMHLGICDEAAYMENLNYVVQDVLMPQTLTTKGKILLASTPPKSPNHDFKKYAQQAMEDGNYTHKTIYDNPRITDNDIYIFMKETDIDGDYTDEQLKAFVKSKTGPNNTTWLREYMAEFITDSDQAVLPGFTENKANEITKTIVKFQKGVSIQPGQIMRPEFYDTYVWMDIGYDDNTGILFGYWDYLRATLVIEDEILIHNPTHQLIAELIKNKEFELWGYKPVYKRVADADSMDIAQLADFGLTRPAFVKPPREQKDSGVNILRTMIAHTQINVHPRCKKLLDQMKSALWDNKRKSFIRSGKFGHFDLLDTLVYAVRTLSRHKSPIPAGHGLNIHDQFINPNKINQTTHNFLDKLIPHNMRPKNSK